MGMLAGSGSALARLVSATAVLAGLFGFTALYGTNDNSVGDEDWVRAVCDIATSNNAAAEDLLLRLEAADTTSAAGMAEVADGLASFERLRKDAAFEIGQNGEPDMDPDGTLRHDLGEAYAREAGLATQIAAQISGNPNPDEARDLLRELRSRLPSAGTLVAKRAGTSESAALFVTLVRSFPGCSEQLIGATEVAPPASPTPGAEAQAATPSPSPEAGRVPAAEWVDGYCRAIVLYRADIDALNRTLSESAPANPSGEQYKGTVLSGLAAVTSRTQRLGTELAELGTPRSAAGTQVANTILAGVDGFVVALSRASARVAALPPNDVPGLVAGVGEAQREFEGTADGLEDSFGSLESQAAAADLLPFLRTAPACVPLR